MSRVGKKPVPVPSGVTATVTGQTVKMKGSKGELQFVVPPQVVVEFKDGAVSVQPKDQSKQARSLWGTSRAQVANLVEGVSKGFEKKLEITGVGYRAAMAGKALKLSLGYSHDMVLTILSQSGEMRAVPFLWCRLRTCQMGVTGSPGR